MSLLKCDRPGKGELKTAYILDFLKELQHPW